MQNSTTQVKEFKSIFHHLPDSYWTNTFGVLFTFTSFAATFQNIIVLITLHKFVALHTNSNIILANLVLIDFLTGILLAPVNAAQLLNKDIMNTKNAELARLYMSTILVISSANTTAAISVDRCLHIVKLSNYQMSKKITFTIIGTCWMIPILTSIVRLLPNGKVIYRMTVNIELTCILVINILFYGVIVFAFFFFPYGFFFPRITSLQSHGLAEKLSQSHGNSRSLQTYYIKKKEKLTQNTQYIFK